MTSASRTAGPGRRFQHSSSGLGSHTLVFGGCDASAMATDDMLLYDSVAYSWIPADVEVSSATVEQSPGKRYGHKAVTVGMHPATVLIYGGFVTNAGAGTYEGFDTPDHFEDSFSSDYDGHVGNIGEDPRAGLEGVFERTFMGLRQTNRFRGQKELINDRTDEMDESVYILTLNNRSEWRWSKPLTSKASPLSRTEFSMVKVSTNKVMVFGGYTRANQVANDLWTFDCQDMEWTEEIVSGIKPKARYRHTAECVGSKMFILGGVNNGEDDVSLCRHIGLSVLDLSTLQWSHPELKGSKGLFPRSGHCSCVVGSKHIAIFGGKALGKEEYSNDLYLIDIETFEVMLVECVENKKPTAVSDAIMFLTGGSKISVFGGIDAKGICYDDIRIIDLGTHIGKVSSTVLEAATTDYSFKVLIIGDSSVGKSCILKRCCENLFTEYSAATIGVDYSSRLMMVDSMVCRLNIWDTAGQEKFGNLTANYYRGATGAMLVFDLGSRDSFVHIKTWYDRARLLGGENIVAVLVGNKSDLPTREVSREEGEAVARELNIPYIETSAKNGSGVEDSFTQMSRAMKISVEKQGLVGVKTANKSKAVRISTTASDRKMKISEKCCR